MNGARRPSINRTDGTLALLRVGIWTFILGVVCMVLVRFALGGINRHGPHTNSGWLALTFGLLCLPFGLMLLALGGAKWLRNRKR